MNVLFVTAGLRMNGRGFLRGRTFAAQLQADGHELLLRHQWEADGEQSISTAASNGLDLSRDITDDRELAEFGPHVVFLERGVLASPGRWRIPASWLDQYVEAGGVVIGEGLGIDGVQDLTPEDAEEIWRWFGAWPEPRVTQPSWAAHIIDQASFVSDHRRVLCPADQMLCSDWLRPCYSTIDAVLASSAIALSAGHGASPLASSSHTSQLVRDDRFQGDPRRFVWATVRQTGFGYRAMLAAAVSHDLAVEANPDNARWLEALMAHLADEVERGRDLYEPTRPDAPIKSLSNRLPAEVLVSQEESATLEFKSSAFVDLKNDVHEKVTFHRTVGKTVAAFANRDGGTLILGCDDDGNVLGWEIDRTDKRADLDAYVQALTAQMIAVFGKGLATAVAIDVETVGGLEVAVLTVPPWKKPVFVVNDRGEQVFYVRVNNTSQVFNMEETVEYVGERWPKA